MLLFIGFWFWAPRKAQNTIIYMVPGLARPGICKNPNVFDGFGRLARRPNYIYLGRLARRLNILIIVI